MTTASTPAGLAEAATRSRATHSRARSLIFISGGRGEGVLLEYRRRRHLVYPILTELRLAGELEI